MKQASLNSFFQLAEGGNTKVPKGSGKPEAAAKNVPQENQDAALQFSSRPACEGISPEGQQLEDADVVLDEESSPAGEGGPGQEQASPATGGLLGTRAGGAGTPSGPNSQAGRAKVGEREATKAFMSKFNQHPARGPNQSDYAKSKVPSAAGPGANAGAQQRRLAQRPHGRLPQPRQNPEGQQKDTVHSSTPPHAVKEKLSSAPALRDVQPDLATARDATAGSTDPGSVKGEDWEDDIEDSEMEASSASGSDGEAAQEAETSTNPKGKLRRAPTQSKAPKKGKAGATATAEGVGAGALEAALQYVAADPLAAFTWQPGAPVPFSFLAATFEAIGNTTKRLAIIQALVGAFRAIMSSTPSDLLPAVYLATSSVGPTHEGLELGIGEATLLKALASATGRQESVLKKELQEIGDLGRVAAASRSTQRTMFAPPPLTVSGVYKTFREIAATTGTASQNRKVSLIQKLLVASKGLEPGFIMRALQGKLRIGLQEQSVLAALGHAALLQQEDVGPRKPVGPGGTTALAERLEAAAQAVKVAYSECPSYDQLVPALVKAPLSELPSLVHFMPGIPIRPMLAKPTTGVGEVLDKFSGRKFTCEYKYDGERAQVHVLEDGSVHIYSRNAEDSTPKFPDVVSRVPSWLTKSTTSVVIDAEVVAWDSMASKILPFQVLSTRARKDVEASTVKVQVCVFAFDCLYLNGQTLLRSPLSERRQALLSALVEVPGELFFATAKTSEDVEELQMFLNEAVSACTEGLIVKTLNDTYEPSRRSNNWLKLKKDYLQGVGDTFDCVPIGAYYGRGKRTGVFGAYLLAVYDEEGENFQTIAKVGTGFSEEQLRELADALASAVLERPKPYFRYGDAQLPDVWLEPIVVWEVKAADLSISPLHQAAQGLVDSDKGISIRFPRFLRVRDDKKPDEATTASQVAEMYRQQVSVGGGKSNAHQKH